jgi:hypothetical protein
VGDGRESPSVASSSLIIFVVVVDEKLLVSSSAAGGVRVPRCATHGRTEAGAYMVYYSDHFLSLAGSIPS